MKDFGTFISLVVVAFLTGLLKAYVVIQVATTYSINLSSFKFSQVYGFIILVNFVVQRVKIKENETDLGEQLGKAIGIGVLGPLVFWGFAHLISLIIVR